MRLHRLELEAFGPFPGHECLDLDELAGEGLFLLHGPTGAGKTSLLDAVCFALYGRTPGERGTADRLRCDHAPPGRRPWVRLEFTASGQRVEITRSPSWQRPKKRGQGMTTVKGSVLVRRRSGGEWQEVTARPDEAGDFVAELVSMAADQFTKIVLLPQGDFAAFLNSTGEQRRALLQKLFGTERFERAEALLAERRRHLAARVDHADRDLLRLTDHVRAAVNGLRGQDPEMDLPAEIADGDLLARVITVRDRVGELLTEAERQALGSERALEHAQRQADSSSAQLQRALRVQELLGRLSGLGDERSRLDCERGQMVAARACGSLSGLLAELAGAEAERHRTAARLEQLAFEPLPEDLDGERDRLLERSAALKAMVELEKQAGRDAAQCRKLRDAVDRGRAQRADADRRMREATDEQAVLKASLDDLQGLAGQLAAREHLLGDAHRAVSATVRAARDRARLTDQQQQVSRLREQSQDLRRHWLDLRELRLNQMAAELAGGLHAGEPCPVCGSPEHPSPAQTPSDQVAPGDEQAAEDAYHRAEDACRQAEKAESRLVNAIEAAMLVAGGMDEDAAREQAARLEAQVAESARAAATLKQRTVRRDELAAEREQQLALIHEADRLIATAEGELIELTARLARAEQDVAEARGPAASVSARLSAVLERANRLREAGIARAEHVAAVALAESLHRRCAGACHAAGFASLDDARAAVRPVEEVEAWFDRADKVDAEIAGLRAALSEPALAAVLNDDGELRIPVAEVGELCDRDQVDLRAARAVRDELALRSKMTRLGWEQLVRNCEQIETELAAGAPLRSEYQLVQELSTTAEGNGPGNQLRMRLSSYVLSARLEHVAQAASTRLEQMTAGRYSLQSGDGSGGRGRRGLGLGVVDSWTGITRDPASLSGGESFMASLSLALGLADVLHAENGGENIETLFVDEGFGTLDDQSLDDVMTVLDGLRDGGRAVGVVSHVDELRRRIPARVEVLKTRTGSSIRRRPVTRAAAG